MFITYNVVMGKKYLFVVNPISKKANKKLGKIIRQLNSIEYSIFYTRADCNRQDLRELVAKGDFTHVIAVGGDGTIHDVLNSTFGLNVCIGVFPLGSGNDFARMFKLSTNTSRLVEMIVTDNTTTIDCGRVNSECFINFCSFGLDAEIVDKSLIYRKFLPNSLTYIPAVYHALITHTPKNMFINGVANKINLIAIHNGKYYGGGMPINFDAHMQDGELNTCKINSMAKLKFMLVFPLVFLKKHGLLKQVEFSTTSHLEIDCSEKILSTLDGEFYDFEYPVKIEVIPDSVKVLIP
jgi:YegS/Rv2252/BmrU family lipid kinase